MATINFTIRYNRDGTVTVRRGKQVEHISADKREWDLVEAARWALITMGHNFTFEEVHDVIQDEKRSNAV